MQSNEHKMQLSARHQGFGANKLFSCDHIWTNGGERVKVNPNTQILQFYIQFTVYTVNQHIYRNSKQNSNNFCMSYNISEALTEHSSHSESKHSIERLKMETIDVK